MRVIKKINNNVAICVDNNGRQLIAFGKGIGFREMPYVITDLNLIDKTYYDINQSYLSLIDEIPVEIFEISAEIIEVAKVKLDLKYNPNLVFILADHIHFAIKRARENIYFSIPKLYDIEMDYKDTVVVAKWAVAQIQNRFNTKLPKNEYSLIAMHLITEATKSELDKQFDIDGFVSRVTELIEQNFDITLDQENFNYYRFVSHLKFLIQRKRVGEELNELSDNHLKIIDDYPDLYSIVMKIGKVVEEHFNGPLSKDEEFYLVIHLNRLCSREIVERIEVK